MAQANALCDTMNESAVNNIPDPGSDPVKGAKVFDQEAMYDSDTLAKLRALPRPPGDEATLDAIFAKVDALVSDSTQLATALRARDFTRVQQLQTAGAADLTALGDASKQYGLTSCWAAP